MQSNHRCLCLHNICHNIQWQHVRLGGPTVSSTYLSLSLALSLSLSLSLTLIPLPFSQALQAAACHENMIKVGGYILGEFGNLIAGDPRSRSVVQLAECTPSNSDIRSLLCRAHHVIDVIILCLVVYMYTDTQSLFELLIQCTWVQFVLHLVPIPVPWSSSSCSIPSSTSVRPPHEPCCSPLMSSLSISSRKSNHKYRR